MALIVYTSTPKKLKRLFLEAVGQGEITPGEACPTVRGMACHTIEAAGGRVGYGKGPGHDEVRAACRAGEGADVDGAGAPAAAV